jgi:glycosyltransferase involved in cell wall biosynthesis
MNERLVVLICEIILIGAVVVALVIVLLASWHDLQTAGHSKRLQRIANTLHRPRQPFLTIVIYTYNNQSAIEDSLDSIFKSRYVNYRLVVADHGSTDKTRSIIKTYRQHHKKHLLTLYSAKASTPLHTVIQRAVQKLPASDFKLVLDASVRIAPNTLRGVMAEYIDNPRLTDIYLRQVPASELSIQTSTAHFYTLTKNIFHKALSVVHLSPRSNDVQFTKNIPSIKRAAHYASNITYQQNGAAKRQSSLYLSLIAIVWLALTILATYWMFTAATLKSNLFLTFSWIILCIWLLATIWSDSATKLGRKIELTLSVPFMYFVFYLRIVGDLFVKLWHIIKNIPFNTLTRALHAELYSTRY